MSSTLKLYFKHKKLCTRSEYKALETKYLIGKETIEKLEKELKFLKETQAGFRQNSIIQLDHHFENQYKNIKTAARYTQTDVLQSNDESCQTDDPKRKDFQAQAYFQSRGETMATQTDSSAKCDFQVQTNIEPENVSLPDLIVNQEIVMPNIPNSMAGIAEKKRKLSKMSKSAAAPTNLAPNDVPICPLQNLPLKPIPADSKNNDTASTVNAASHIEPQRASANQSPILNDCVTEGENVAVNQLFGWKVYI